MTKSKKDFDCVEMKWNIQKQLAEETRGMTEEQAQAYHRKNISQNPVLSEFLNRVEQYQTKKVA